VAFARSHGDDLLVAVVPRLTMSLTTAERPLPIGGDVWTDTHVVLSETWGRSGFRNVLTGEVTRPDGGGEVRLALASVLRTCPVALLWGRSA
jgi:maltooligosyltrehalose synthase